MPLSLGTSLGNARLGISTKWPKGISLGANIPLGVDPVKAKKRNIEYSGSKHQIRNNSINKMVGQATKANFYSRPCLYYVRVQPPGNLLPGSDTLQEINFNCESVTFPGIQLSTKPHKTYGIAREYAYERLLTPLNMSFYVSDNFQEFQFFQRWMEYIMPADGRFNYPADYSASTIQIFQCSNRAEYSAEELPVMMSCKLTQAFPKTIGDLTLGHGLKDTFHKVPVTIVYNKIQFTNNLASGSGVNQAIQQGQDHLQNAWNSFSEAGTMLKDKFDDLALPKLGTLLKKKSSFLPASMDAIRGGGSSASSAGNAGNAGGISTNDLGAGSKYV
jgi:hypothetical protein